MPRTGISFDEVAAVADRLTAEGISPTNKNTREILTTGSPNTIQRHLTVWREARPQPIATAPELPAILVTTINQVITQATAAARAEVEDRLVIVLAEAAELSETGEKLETNLVARGDELESMTNNRDTLLGQIQVRDSEIDRLTRENERERYAAEQARTAIAQSQNKLEGQAEKLLELSATVSQLTVEKTAESQGRISAEKDVAVLHQKLEADNEKYVGMLQEKDDLIEQVKAAKQSAEEARIESAKHSNKLELSLSTLAEKISEINRLTELVEIERSARKDAENKTAILQFKFGRQGTVNASPVKRPLIRPAVPLQPTQTVVAIPVGINS